VQVRLMTPRHRRQATALALAVIVTGLTCGLTTNPIANLALGLAHGIPAGLTTWALLATTARLLGATR
jgi:hypothetical protein